MKKRLFIIGASVIILCGSFTVPVSAMEQSEGIIINYEMHDTTINGSVRSAIIEWRYKFENGKIYKRLYDYTNQNWVGDWILC